MDLKKVNEIINKYNGEKNWLIAIFQDVQAEYRYLPKEAIGLVANRLKIPLTQAYAVATFYKSFSLVPRGEHEIHVCLGTACHLRGGQRLVENFQRTLAVKAGETTKDMKFTLETVNCLGACALAPLVRVDQKNYGKVTTDQVQKIVKEYRPDGEGKSHGKD
ncbi:MAG: NAD(P)H-dependent oxidoreductase subunit E [Deltaproteobacteria bacterium]|jgi:NADH-quinone oxidoreductase subunit E|nr:NAD(P)H-dependent oxidoreductase subunit E [Deltaproteobacteria bacterium]